MNVKGDRQIDIRGQDTTHLLDIRKKVNVEEDLVNITLPPSTLLRTPVSRDFQHPSILPLLWEGFAIGANETRVRNSLLWVANKLQMEMVARILDIRVRPEVGDSTSPKVATQTKCIKGSKVH